MSNAKRFGGAHSPGARPSGADVPKGAAPKGAGGAKPPRGPARSPLAGRKTKQFSWRVLFLYIAPTPLALAGLEGILGADLPQILWAWGGYGALMLAAWLTGQGLQAEAAYDARVIAKPPAFPRKIVAAALCGVAVAGACVIGAGLNLLLGLFYGALSAGAHVAAFGLDPMRAKGGAGVSDAELDRVAEKLDQAEAVVAETVAAGDTLRDRELSGRIDALAYAARDILREIQSDPRDLRRSRQFLSVHLVGLRDATVKYADAAGKGAADGLRDRYAALLADLEASFADHKTSLLVDDQSDLEVEIDVLRERLGR